MWQDVGIARGAARTKPGDSAAGRNTPSTRPPSNPAGLGGAQPLPSGLAGSTLRMAREESRGAHYRTDFPDHDDVRFLKHSIAQKDSIRFE